MEYRFHRGALRNTRCGADDVFVYAHADSSSSVVGDCDCDECSVNIASASEVGGAHWFRNACHLFGRSIYRSRSWFAVWFVGVDRWSTSGRHFGWGVVVAE